MPVSERPYMIRDDRDAPRRDLPLLRGFGYVVALFNPLAALLVAAVLGALRDRYVARVVLVAVVCLSLQLLAASPIQA